MNKKKNNDISFICTEEFKTNQENVTEEELIKIFNQKFYKTIMKIENNISIRL